MALPIIEKPHYPKPKWWICPNDGSKWDGDGEVTPKGYYGDPPRCPRCDALLVAPE